MRAALTILAALVALGGAAAARAESAPPVTVFAAASLTDVLQEIGQAFTARTGVPVRFSFAASSALARQVEAGARADLFLSADQEWMDYLQARGLIRGESRRDLIGNRLVLIAPADSPLQLRLATGAALPQALGRGRLATGDPDTVPVGRYARAALTSLGLWDGVAPRLVRADNVRSALAFVARGEAPLGIVYATDARLELRVRVVDVFPADSHPSITYPAALTARSVADARRLLEFLSGAEAAAAFARHGFLAVQPGSALPAGQDTRSERSRGG